jgi:MYXO-CTERM domain-containing protein
VSKYVLGAAAAAMMLTAGVGVAEAHINLSWPLPRYEVSGVNQKTGPCGGGTASMDVTDFAPGEELTVTWVETVNHPGHFRIALDTTGTDDFADPTSENDMDVVGNVIAYVPDEGGSNFQYTFNLPDVECENCVLQVIQVMTDKLGNGFAGSADGGDDIYYWCADITITQGGGTTTSSSSSTGAGGASGTGGSDPSGGAGGSSSTSSGSGQGVDQSGFDNNDGGCSVAALGPEGPSEAGWWALAALAFGALVRRRRR